MHATSVSLLLMTQTHYAQTAGYSGFFLFVHGSIVYIPHIYRGTCPCHLLRVAMSNVVLEDTGTSTIVYIMLGDDHENHSSACSTLALREVIPAVQCTEDCQNSVQKKSMSDLG